MNKSKQKEVEGVAEKKRIESLVNDHFLINNCVG